MSTPPRATSTADPPGSRELALKLWVVLSRARSAVRDHAHADIAANGLTPGEFAVLEVLYHKGPLLLGEVQRRILVSSGGITFLVDSLVRRGLVDRRACPTDRRARYAALTAEGEALIRRIFPCHAACIENATSGLTDEEKRQAIALMRKLGRVAASLPPCGRSED